MTPDGSTDAEARQGLETLRASAEVREHTRRPALVEDAAGGEPIVYDDEPEGASNSGIQHKRPKRRR